MSKIHSAILSAMADIAKTGIAKSQKNKEQHYNFRGIEAAMNEMSVILIKNKITITPTYTERVATDHPTKTGGVMHFVSIRGSFKFEADDGSSITTEYYGEGADVSDKATTKAQSVAYRTALFQTFVVPTMAMDPEGDEGEEPISEELAKLLQDAQSNAEAGLGAYQEFFTSLTKEQRHSIGPYHDEFKKIASEVTS